MENHMSTTSCINHPQQESILVLHDWQLDFCHHDQVAAGLMSLFEYWHNVKIKIQNKKPKNQHKHLDLLQFHTEHGLIDKLLYITKTPACIRRAITFLKQKKIITVHKNPNERYAFDRTRHFLFHPEVANNWLKKRYEKINSISEPEKPIEPKMGTNQPTKTAPVVATAVISSPKKPPIVEKKTGDIIFDFALKDFSLSEQTHVYKILNDLNDNSLQQAVVDECNQALSMGKVHNVLAYLAALVKRANQGLFSSTARLAQQRELKTPLTPATLSPPQAKKPHELFPAYPDWQAKQEQIKALFKLSDYMSFVLSVRAYHSDKILFLRCINVHSKNFLEKNLSNINQLFDLEIKIYLG